MTLHRTQSAQGAQSSNNTRSSQGQDSGENGQTEGGQGLASLLAKHDNDPMAVAQFLYNEKFAERDARRKLREKTETLEATIQQYEALGAPNEIAAKLRKATIDMVAGKAQYNPTVLAKLDEMAGSSLEYEAKTETVAGKSLERVYVKDTTDPDAKPQLLDEFAKAKWADFLPSLQVEQAPPAAGNGRRPLPAGPAGSGQTRKIEPAYDVKRNL